jgi:hypothetical protein
MSFRHLGSSDSVIVLIRYVIDCSPAWKSHSVCCLLEAAYTTQTSRLYLLKLGVFVLVYAQQSRSPEIKNNWGYQTFQIHCSLQAAVNPYFSSNVNGQGINLTVKSN